MASSNGYAALREAYPAEPAASSFRRPQRGSYVLSGKELKELYKPTGHMPQISFESSGILRDEAQRRVAELESELRGHMQGICDRLCLHASQGQQAKGAGCLGRLRRWLQRTCQLGVLREILPQILFFAAYSLFVAYQVSGNEFQVLWTAVAQDAIYYPAVVLSFLLCFRASGCMDRYKEGQRAIFEMEKCLREVAFEVMTRLILDVEEGVLETLPPDEREKVEMRQLRKQYFKHEFRRLARLLFACAARDLNDSAVDPEEAMELTDQMVAMLDCAMTKVEHAAVLVTHSAFGHAFRVYLASAWLLKLVRSVDEAKLFDGDDLEVFRNCEARIGSFKSAWLVARQIAYTSMPGSITHIMWLLTTVMSLFMPWEWVTVTQWNTWFPSVLLSISFWGILNIANTMENPFGFDADDIPVSQVATHLDEEVCLAMHYAALDEFGGENLYRSLMGAPMIFLDEAGLPGCEGLAMLSGSKLPKNAKSQAYKAASKRMATHEELVGVAGPRAEDVEEQEELLPQIRR